MTDEEAIQFRMRRCWVNKANLRHSMVAPQVAWPSWTTLVLEWVEVHESMRRQGVFTRFLAEMLAQPGYELFVVESVQNAILADYLMRHDWDFDPMVMDFYRFARVAVTAWVAPMPRFHIVAIPDSRDCFTPTLYFVRDAERPGWSEEWPDRDSAEGRTRELNYADGVRRVLKQGTEGVSGG